MHEVQLTAEYPEKLSRGLLLLRSFFGLIYVVIPHYFCLGFLGLASAILSFLAFWVVLFTGRYPEGWFNFNVGVMRWGWRVIAYLMFYTDHYPPFSTRPKEGAGVDLQITYPEKISRGLVLLRVFFGWIYVFIPHGFCLMFRGIATGFLIFLAWWVVLFTGKYPERWFHFNVGTTRWQMNVIAYMSFFTDRYPPFTGKPAAA